MHKDEYLSSPEVAGYVNYLKTIIVAGDGALTQQYRVRKGSGKRLDIKGFMNAVQQYEFAGLDFERTQEKLDELSNRLVTAMYMREDDTASELDLLLVCLDTLNWGRVTNRKTVSWLANRARLRGLSGSISAGFVALTLDDDDLKEFEDSEFVRSDSATTKIFSLIDGNSIVYDNRFGAAMGKFVVTFLEGIDAQEVPATLQFMAGSRTRRNPRTERYRFSPKTTGLPHAIWNQRANWIVGSLASDPEVMTALGVTHSVGACRAVEAAMFMIGGDIRSLRVNVPTTSKKIPIVNEGLVGPIPLNLVGRAVEGPQTVTGYNFGRVLSLFQTFRADNPGCSDLSQFRDRLRNIELYRRSTAEAYCFPLRDGEFGLRNEADELVARLAEEPLSEEVEQWLLTMSNRPRLPRSLIACASVAALSIAGVDNTYDRSIAVIDRGFAGTVQAATTFLQVGSSFGRYFGLLDDQNYPTDKFYNLFPADDV